MARCLIALGAQAAQPAITARIEPASIALGDSAQLTVNVNGSQEQPELPHVNGLEFTPTGQSTQIEDINGETSASSACTYDVTAARAGTFTIPGIQAGGAVSTPVSLQVGPGSPNAAPGGLGSNSTALPPPSVGMTDQDNSAPPPDNASAFLRLVAPKRDFYVGEVVPVEIKAYFLQSLDPELQNVPALETEAFTLNPLGDKPEQTEETINGRDYSVLTWHSTIAAVKAGSYPLSLTMPVTLPVPVTPSGDSGAFGDGFFKSFFGSTQRKEVELHSESQTIKIAELPTENRPANFSGAIGRFKVAASASPVEVAVGDPITLRLNIKGAGNFERITPTDLLTTRSTEWKTYKASATFQPQDSVGYQGSKTFEQSLVPLNQGIQKIPALTFAYLDPETRHYVSEQTQPITIRVTQAPVGTASVIPVQATDISPKTGIQQDLAPNKIAPGTFVSTLRPVFFNPWFLAGQLLPIGACAAGLMVARRRNTLAKDSRLLRSLAADCAVREEVQAMDSAVAKEDAAAFFLSARGALQQRLGERWRMLPQAITLNEINARLNGDGDNIRPIFEFADAISYSRQSPDAEGLREWKSLVLNELKNLKEQNDHTLN
jgi:hypothetical protein